MTIKWKKSVKKREDADKKGKLAHLKIIKRSFQKVSQNLRFQLYSKNTPKN